MQLHKTALWRGERASDASKRVSVHRSCACVRAGLIRDERRTGEATEVERKAKERERDREGETGRERERDREVERDREGGTGREREASAT